VEAIPEATRLGAAHRRLAAFLVLTRAQTYLAGDTAIANAIESGTATVSITSSPPGATVAIEDYVTPDSGWFELGTTPLDSVRIPLGYFRWKVAKAGVGEETVAPIAAKKMNFALDTSVAAPEGMVPVPARAWGNYVAFVGWISARLPAYYVDKFEVTNRQYQEFVDQGGYTTRKYWTEPFVQDGHALTWDQAMALFRDRSQRPGPSTWEGGHYPAGQDDYPVSGVSWYEASAYAAFAGKALPTFAQWYEMAPAGPSFLVVGQSNISRSSVAPVGAFNGLGAYGTYDMAGNVREWTMNAFGSDRRFILGGKWDSQSYLYSDPESLSPFDRAPGNGIRCVRNLGPLPPQATAAVTPMERDFTRVHPASDAEFATVRATYAYDATAPLNARVEGVVQDTADWREERVTFDAAYGGQRLAAYLFLPKRVAPPYQTVLFFPSARVLDLTDSRHLGDVSFFDYIVQSGRAVMYPVYQDTYERRQLHSMPGQFGRLTISVQRSQDLERALDYLQTRPDIAADKLAYLGVSAGSAEGVVYATLAQRRLKTVIFLDGGFFLNLPPAAMDQVNFAPRLTLPVLMVNGRYDFTFMLEQSQEPMFRMLGTPAADKRHVVMDTPHDVRNDRPTLVKEVLGWLDKYLGRVE
jgi:eukaryotic-like serine/threonine-protein kinase